MALAASCGSGEQPSTPSTLSVPASAPPTTNAADHGAFLFATDPIGGEAGCSSCHSLDPDRSTSGPSLAGIGTTAETRVADLDAEAYLRQSIVAPEAAFAPGWGAGMPTYRDRLSDAEVDALVAYLLALD